MTRRLFLIAILVSLAAVIHAPAAQPNIIVILADDVGYGDLGCYGAKSVRTPNLDRLAVSGIRFTDAHSPAAVCTPSRYSLLTGQYSFRHKPGASILSGVAPLSIPQDRETLPKLLKSAGYATGAVGKWHLGLGEGKTDYNKEIKPGAREVGFDYSFLIPATGDRTPCVFVENGRVVGYDPKDPIAVSYEKKIGTDPTGLENPGLLTNQKPSHGHNNTIVNGISRIGWMTGGNAARWKDEDIADTITKQAVKFISDHKTKPFFLYFATNDAHVPRAPHPRFKGRSPHGLRGDAIEQLDWCVGEIMRTVADNKLENTLIIFTTDNGGVMDDGYVDGTQNDTSGHKCNGILKGFKGALFEGGHRVPFILSWPGHAPTGKDSRDLICHVDLFASFARIVNAKLPEGAAPDSIDQSAAFTGKVGQPARTELLHQSGNFNHLALRQNEWKYIPTGPRGGGEVQLYNLAEDLSETKNLAKEHPERVKAMAARLAELRK